MNRRRLIEMRDYYQKTIEKKGNENLNVKPSALILLIDAILAAPVSKKPKDSKIK